MRAVVQRVSSASVTVAGEAAPRAVVGPGFLVLVGVKSDDTDEDARSLAQKIATLRVLEDSECKLNLSLQDTSGSALVISNFTLYGDCRKGRRPSFTDAASGSVAERLFLLFGACLEQAGVAVSYGVFGAEMQVSLINDGPVTVLLDSRKQF